MIAIGLDSDQTYLHFLAMCDQVGAPCVPINLNAVEDWLITLDGRDQSYVVAAGERVPLDGGAAVYHRLVDLSPVLDEATAKTDWRALVFALQAWLEIVPGRVVNKPGFELHNATKPLHAHRLRELGLRVPDTLVTSDLRAIHAFIGEHGPSIVKTLCGVRATAAVMGVGDFAAFTPEQGPVQLQRYVAGTDIRIHVVGAHVHAEHIASDRPDYRDADADQVFSPFEVPAELRAVLVDATRGLGLAFAGWDFKIDRDGALWCLEANPMPGYDGYDRRAAGAISRSLIAYLEAGDAH